MSAASPLSEPVPAADRCTGEALLDRIRAGLIGDREVIEGPFGPRRLVYADYTATGRALGFIEDFLRARVLPRYANTHTEASWTGRQMTLLREEAREVIRRAVGGDGGTLVIFTGSGATGAIDKLVGILGLRLPSAMQDRYRLADRITADDRPVVFIGPFEHHSNELPWRESIADVVSVPTDPDGHIDRAVLAAQLPAYRHRRLRIGSFSAASNVTGIRSDVPAVTRLLHRHGALAFWDYAAAGPYLPIDVAAGDGAHLDAVFLSPHKFVGGPGSPGVLVVRRDLVNNRVPVVAGGGTVAYVGPGRQDYLADLEQREEGGTPDIVGAIRAGLAVQLKEAVGTDLIRDREHRLWDRVRSQWGADPAIRILGSATADRLPIVSFLIRQGDRYLHHNYVAALLNDLFGIQTRSGCSCAGPYGHQLLDIGLEQSRAHEELILSGWEGLKPGWVRLNFNYFLDEETVDYLIRAVQLVAKHGWRLLTRYRFDPRTGGWRHRAAGDQGLVHLADLAGGGWTVPPPVRGAAAEPAAVLRQAADLLRAAGPVAELDRPSGLPPRLEQLRWFPLPPDCLASDPA